jgi:CRP-like cAMP-binding protein
MTQMAQIEKVVFLQGVELFAFCNAEQLLQLASIASDRSLAAGENIFSSNEPPDALYCVVEGRVGLSGPDRDTTTVSSGETFGVLDILSDQLRARDAVAAADSRLLVIEAEDFFDLMSNNIEIVRALFRQLTRSSIETAETLL